MLSKNKKYLLLVLGLLICQNVSATNDHFLNISANIVEGTCSSNFVMVRFEFRKASNSWRDIEKFYLSYGSERKNRDIKIISGEKLIAWNEVNNIENQRKSIENSSFLASLALASSVALFSGSEKVKNIGKIGTLLTLGTFTSDQLSKISEKYRGNIFPRNPLYRGKILVPPWVVFGEMGRSKFQKSASVR